MLFFHFYLNKNSGDWSLGMDSNPPNLESHSMRGKAYG